MDQIIQNIFLALDSIAPAYQFEIPADNTSHPVILFYLYGEKGAIYADDENSGDSFILSIDLWHTADDRTLAGLIESSIQSLDFFPQLIARQVTKEDNLFRFHFEFDCVNFS